MRSFVVGVAGSVVASALVYFALAAMEALSPPLRLGAMALVLVLGVIVAWLASRGSRPPEEETSVGHRIKAKGDVTVKGVDVARPDGDVRVGDDLKSDGDVIVQDVRVGRDRDPK